MTARDGMVLGGSLWSHGEASSLRSIVVIAAATSVASRYYSRFALYLFKNGFDVLTFDYRGIGASRPAGLRGFRAGWLDWGQLDLEAAIRFACENFPGRAIDVVGHSIGGFAIGLAPSNSLVRRTLTVGSQYAYWRDYGSPRVRMLLKWHLVMPVLTAILGYFPGKAIGWMEDTPAGVVRDWSSMKARFEETLARSGPIKDSPDAELLRERFRRMRAPMLAISIDDDPHGTASAVERLLAYFAGSDRTHLRLSPADIGEAAIGHFSFFHQRHTNTLWPIALQWLKDGTVAPELPGTVVRRHPMDESRSGVGPRVPAAG